GTMFDGSETRRYRRARRRQWQQPQCRLRYHTQHSLRSDEQSDKVKPGLILVRWPADTSDVPISEHDFEAEHVMTGYTVLQTARPAGVRRDVAADRGMFETRGIGRIEEPAT